MRGGCADPQQQCCWPARDSADQLKTRADEAHGGEQAKLCLEYARMELEDSNALFTDGQVDKAQAANSAKSSTTPARAPMPLPPPANS